jgi:large subunit ribosomal protein L4
MTLSVALQNPADEKATSSTVELPANVFDVPTNVSLIHQVVVAQLAAARQGTHATKTRGEVRGGGKKPYRQKGTGRARQGSTRAPQFAGGGVVHGPQPRSYDQRTPKKMKAAALRGALSDRARNDRVFVVSSLVAGDAPSTREASATLAKVSTAKNVLVVAERTDELTWLSLRNIPSVHILEPGQLNTYDVLISDDVVFTKGALEAFVGGELAVSEAPEATPAKKAEAKPAAKKAAAKKAVPAADESAADVTDDTADDDAKPAAKKAAAKKAPAKKATATAETADSADDSAAEQTAEETD